jgi:ElaB/YqjD/DUF883 family membrane-anchored ribosome-binding protein
MTNTTYPTHPAQSTRLDGAVEATGNGAGTHQPPLTDRMAQGAHHTIDRLAENAGPRIERMEGALADATGQLRDQVRHVREKGDEWTDSLRATVRRHPLSVVATAVAVGALIARITR